MLEQCNRCRFWLFAEEGDTNGDSQPNGWGWCRRNPPAIVERMAAMLIPPLGNREDNYDPEDVATVSRITDCSLFPATFHDRWCGRFEPVKSVDPHPAWLVERNTLIDYLDTKAPTEAEADEGASRLNACDSRIMATPATTKDGVFAKLLLAVQMTAEGHNITEGHAAAFVVEAQTLTGIGRLSPQAAQTNEVAP